MTRESGHCSIQLVKELHCITTLE